MQQTLRDLWRGEVNLTADQALSAEVQYDHQ